jgi:tetrahydromethanopterin S-methyltransferase subunit C
MRWFGIGLALAGVVAALLSVFLVKDNVPLIIGIVIGCILFFVVGIIVFIYGTRTLPK